MASMEQIQAALRSGEERTLGLLEERQRIRQERAAALNAAEMTAAEALPTVGSTVLNSAGPITLGTLVAEGDSWFDYPFNDVLKVLEDSYGYEVESVAHRGDEIEEMAYSGGQLDGLLRVLEKVHRRSVPIKAVLLSGGGNDISGKHFRMLLNHAASPLANLSDGVAQAVIDERILTAYVTILSAVTKACTESLGAPVPILVHGYDYPVPDGRGFLGGWGPLPGPWLEPGFRDKGFGDLQRRKEIMVDLMDRFNDMLQRIVSLPAFGHVHYLDLRNTLSTDQGTYKQWWANELHPRKEGFEKIARQFHQVLSP
ncbi:MAG: hypothetical protein KDD47_19495 [Acidobacteria bacterium]|nr:hypothetical protein [Acidobacteriota bacterium]